MTAFISPYFWLTLTQIIIILFTAFIAWMTYRSHLFLKEIQPDFNILLSRPENIIRLLLLLFCLFLAWLSGLSATTLGLVVLNPWRSIALGVGVGFIVQLCVYWVTLQAVAHFGHNIYSPWLIRNILPQQSREWLPIALAFMPAIAMEELLFRTLWIGVFEVVMPLWLLIIITSMIFGFMHQPQGKLGMIGAGAINIVFCLLFIWSGELLVTYVAHYTVNMLQLVTAYFQQDWLESY